MTRDEMLSELQGLLAKADDPEGYYSVAEIAEMLGLGDAATKKRLKVAQNAGRLEVHKTREPSIDGRMMPTYRYRITPEKVVRLA